jgi:[ribosomal protein S5]-alanine N-acetyltransferase
VERLAGDRAIAAGTLLIPYPYPPGAAASWISTHAEAWAEEQALDLAVGRLADGVLIGAIGLGLEFDHARAQLGYWVGRPYWAQGYATEAAREVLRYAFDELGLARVYAFHFSTNPASGRVLEKIGMKHEGVRRAHSIKWGRRLDEDAYGILRDEFEAAR